MRGDMTGGDHFDLTMVSKLLRISVFRDNSPKNGEVIYFLK